MPPVDATTRYDAITTHQHAFVWASAGTGKTHTLTLRALYLILYEPFLFENKPELDLYFALDPLQRQRAAQKAIRAVVLTTFTRKAAAQMRARLIDYLEELSGYTTWPELLHACQPAPNQLLFACLKNILTQLQAVRPEMDPSELYSYLHQAICSLLTVASELQISTLHSYAATILQRHAIAAGLPSQIKFLDEDDQNQIDIEDQLLDLWWRREVPNRPQLLATMPTLLAHISTKDMNTWFLQQLKTPRLFAAIETAGKLPEEDQTTFLENMPAFDQLTTNKNHVVNDIWQAFLTWLAAFANWSQDAALRELNILTFDAVVEKAAHLLENNKLLRELQQTGLKALLVDEFQDTDLTQLSLLEHLLETQPDQPVLGFFVGDIKQSIYGFRGVHPSDVTNFIQRFKTRHTSSLGVTEFQLQANFRSTPEVIDFANHLFGDVFELASVHEQLIPTREKQAYQPICYNVVNTQPTNKKDMHVLQANVLIKKIIALRQQQPDLAYSDILILTRRNSVIQTLLPHLLAAKLPVVSPGLKQFYRQSEVLDIISLLISLIQPLDSVALAALLRSPIVGLTDQELNIAITQHNHQPLLYGPDLATQSVFAHLPKSLHPILTNLQTLAKAYKEMPAQTWLTAVEEFFPVGIYLAQAEQDRPQVLARIEQTFERVHQIVRHRPTDLLAWLLTQRQRVVETVLSEQDAGQDVEVEELIPQAINIMTIHQAKGLEAPVVFLYAWEDVLHEIKTGKIYPSQRKPAVIVQASDYHVQLPWGPISFRSPTYEQAYAIELTRQQEEAKRLAYVAVTRARDQLYILMAKQSTKTLAAFQADFSGQLAAYQPWYVEELDVTALPQQLTTAVNTEDTAAPLLLPFNHDYTVYWQNRYQDQDKPKLRLYTPSHVAQHNFELAIDQDQPIFIPGLDDDTTLTTEHVLQRQNAQQLGTLVHRYLELFVQTKQLHVAALAQLATFMGSVSPAVLARATNVLTNFFSGISRDEAGRPFVDYLAKSTILGKEIPFYLQHNGMAWHGIIDLLLQENNCLLVVDYKTGKPQDPLPESYLAQAKIYRQAIARRYPHVKVSFGFWYLG